MIFLKKIYSVLITLKRLNIIKTLYFNFKMLPLTKAMRLPIFLYGRICILKLSGSLILPDIIHMGMIRIGYRWHDLWPCSFLPTQIQIVGKLHFGGDAIISGGVNLNVQKKAALLNLGPFTTIGGGCIIKCLQHIEIGDNTSITGNCTIMDCNMHYVKNITTGIISNNKAPIIIGRNCWINYGSIVSKGAVVPDYSITSRNAYISKDYSKSGTNLFLIGSPAVVSSTKVQRIFTIAKQDECKKFFETQNKKILQLDPGLENETGRKEGF